MLHIFEEYKNGKLALALNGGGELIVDGMESFSIPERFKFFFKEASLSTDKILSKLSFNIHQVDTKVLAEINKNRSVNFLRAAAFPITVPAFYNAKVTDFNSYQSKVVQSVLLVSQINVEAETFYKWLKDIVKTGKVTKLHSFAISDFEELISESETFLDQLEAGESKKKPISELYDSFGKMEESINWFNTNVKVLKARDVELIDKQFNNIYEIAELLYRKIKANDIVISKEDLDLVKDKLIEIARVLNITGAMVGLLNELSAVYRSQVSEVKTMK